MIAIRQERLLKIQQLKKEIDTKHPLSQSELRELRKWYDVSFTYNSNAIEGNTLTLAETKVIIEDGLTIGGKQIKEILEAKNHKTSLDLLFQFTQKKTDLSENIICKLHQNLLFDIDKEDAGHYRHVQVFISGSNEKLPNANEVAKLMKDFLKWYQTSKSTMNPVLLSIETHYRFVKIHPFIDGNGRIARLILNLILLQNNYTPIIIPVIQRLEYIQSIQQSLQAFTDFMLNTIYQNMKDYLRMITK